MVKKILLSEWSQRVEKLLRSTEHNTHYAITEKPIVLVPDEFEIDLFASKRLGYTVYPTKHKGGVIVTNIGDIGIVHLGNAGKQWYDFFIKEFIGWLKDRNLNAELDNNDIVIDGYKVCGVSTKRVGALSYTAGVIGINTKLSDIQAICKKPMQKIPKGLSDYGVTSEEVEQWFLSFCKKCEQGGID